MTANTVELDVDPVSGDVKLNGNGAKIASIQSALPKGVTLRIVYDQSALVRSALLAHPPASLFPAATSLG